MENLYIQDCLHIVDHFQERANVTKYIANSLKHGFCQGYNVFFLLYSGTSEANKNSKIRVIASSSRINIFVVICNQRHIEVKAVKLL